MNYDCEGWDGLHAWVDVDLLGMLGLFSLGI